jgi:HlyD family secretion protein
MRLQIKLISLRAIGACVLGMLSLQAQAVDVAARLDWAELHYASVPVEGFVDQVLVHEGQRVNKGDKVLQLDNAVLSATVKQSRAHVAMLLPPLADARREYNDAKVLYEQTVLSDVELQRAKMAFDIAAAKHEEAEARLAADKALLARAAQYAPWDAWVIERHAETGQVIAGDERSKPLIILARADKRVAQAYISYDARSRLAPGQAIKLRYRDKDYEGVVQSIAMKSDGITEDSGYRLRVEFDVNSTQLYRLGDAVTLSLP